MTSEIITIGDEILIGQIVDTNSAWIAARLNDAGISVERRLSVGDTADAISEAVRDSMSRSALTIVTGGLGPTRDDITKPVLAAIFGGGMKRDEETYYRVGKMMERRGFAFNDLNKSQAVIPAAAEVLPNHNGTAPGMWFEKEGRILVSLPGVPFEMEALFIEEVLPRLRSRFKLKSIVHRTMITHGIAEAILAEKIAEWEDTLPHEVKLAYLPSPRGVRLRLSVYDTDARHARGIIEERFGQLKSIIPDNIVGYEDASLENVLLDKLGQMSKTISIAESCTGGRISSMITAIPGASDIYRGGVVAYSNDLKVSLLKVKAEDIEKYGAVSREVAEQMASGVRTLTGSDYSVSTTGVAGPSGGTEAKPVGTVWIAVASEKGVVSEKFIFGNLRVQNIERASAAALNMLRKSIEED